MTDSEKELAQLTQALERNAALGETIIQSFTFLFKAALLGIVWFLVPWGAALNFLLKLG